MTTWNLSPQYKKSAVEKMFFYKEDKLITIEQGFRWANFKVTSDDRPLTDEELKNEDGYELSCIANDECWEMWDMTDGCWLDIEAGNDKTTEEDVEKFTKLWEEDSYDGVEGDGWSQDDCEYYYYGPLALTNEDTGEEFLGEPDENISVSGVPHETNTDNPIDFPTVGVPMMDMKEKLEVLRELEEEKSALTDWYPASINPVRNGTYQVLETETEVQWPFPSNVTAGVWDGTKWDKPVEKWRGLNKDPKGE